MADINERLRIVQSWWLGSELVRRHPDLTLIETHPGGAQYDCLTLVRAGREVEPLVHMNRIGKIHIVASDLSMTWAEERDFGDRHGAVRRIESAAGLSAPQATPPSAPTVLSLRAIYRILASMLNEREPWDARSAYYDSSGEGSGSVDLSAFPSAANSIKVPRPNDPFGQPGYRFWCLGPGHASVAILDSDGGVHLRDKETSLSDAYVRSGRSLTAAISMTLGAVLP